MLAVLEEVRELDIFKITSTTNALNSLVNLKKALFSANKLLKNCRCGSKIYLVELMLMQLKRAKKRADTRDIELAMDMMVVFSNEKEGRNADSAILERFAKKLELHSIADSKEETVAFKEIAGIYEDFLLDGPVSTRSLRRCQSLMIPHEFLCPITMEIMTDPVITYDRASIQKWRDSNHRTCPKMGQTLDHLSLAPKFALKSPIQQWCEKNNYDLPKKYPCAKEVSRLVQNLSSCQLDVLKKANHKIRMLSKENPENRILIANSGGIPQLIKLLSYLDSKIQDYTVTALLNLPIDEANKRLIAREGSIPRIVEILQHGTDEAGGNSAATLFSLSMLGENKVLVGALNGIPPLVDVLQNGTVRGKKDAATALFNLSLNQANKSRAINSGLIPPLLHLLEHKNLGMTDEALSTLLLLASHPEEDGTPKNKECATSVLLELGLNNSSVTLAALQYGVYEHLVKLARCGTNRGQRKANSLLQQMSKFEHIPQHFIQNNWICS
ncbi:unnamed protein product [Malus baccata var. baccata]